MQEARVPGGRLTPKSRISVTTRRNLVAAFTLILICGAILLSLATRLTPYVRNQAVTTFNERFQSDVHLDVLQVSAFPRPEVTGGGLQLRHNGRTDVPPLIKIDTYGASAGLFGLFSSPVRLRTVELSGLEISIPPGGMRHVDAENGLGANPPRSQPSGDPQTPARFTIDRLVSRAARLEIIPRERGKLPRTFEIHDLVMLRVGHGDGSEFEATLTNPTPKGLIQTRGTFGPWNGAEPRLTQVKGDYVFTNATLNTIKGIAGTLSSTGSYSGALERIDVKGETNAPDFSIDVAGQPVPLETRFHAIVDGTNGNTWLEDVQARLAETVIVAKGAVVRTEDVKGRKITLDVTIADGRIEDVLKLAVKAERPLMTGGIRLDTRFVLPAGDQDVVDKLQLAGTFKLDRARFTNVNVQEKINTLSHRGKGQPNGEGPGVVSNLSGRFTLKNASLNFTDLTFSVPGAVVALAGTFDLKRETIDFSGHLLLDASLAETTTGMKAVLARIAQPLFSRKGGGSKLPIRISGPFSKPEFGLDVKRALTPGD
jgi:hypothetical protein